MQTLDERRRRSVRGGQKPEALTLTFSPLAASGKRERRLFSQERGRCCDHSLEGKMGLGRRQKRKNEQLDQKRRDLDRSERTEAPFSAAFHAYRHLYDVEFLSNS